MVAFSEGWLIAGSTAVVSGIFWAAWTVRGALDSARAAHHRIDRIEASFERLGDKLESAIENAWRNCPLAHAEHGDRKT